MPTPRLKASVHLDTQNSPGIVDPRVFGGFLEHIGRAVYEGVYDPQNPLSDERGFRRDVLDALRPLGFSIMRYPGGNFVSAYDWKDGIGPKDKRPRRPDFAWKSIETNQFGTDEFIDWCRALKTEPMLAVNLGTAGPAEAAQLVEYCNLPGGTLWSDRRRQFGHSEPHAVKLWCLGNEMDGHWQAGHVTADVYAQRARAAAGLMKGIDSTIQTIACGSSGVFQKTYLDWDRTVLDFCWEKVDFISAHRYSNNNANDSAAFLAEGVEIDQILRDYAGLIAYSRAIKSSNKTVHLSFDEWNVWYKARADDGKWSEAPHLLEEVYNVEDALVCAQYLSAFVRRADLVKIACLAQIVNVIAPILTRKDGLLIQSIYWPFKWFSSLAPGRKSLTPMLTSPTCKAGPRGEVPALDAAATYDADSKTVVVFLTNRMIGQEMKVTVDVADKTLIRAIGGEGIAGSDLKAANTWENPGAVKPIPANATIANGKLEVVVPGPGFVCTAVQL